MEAEDRSVAERLAARIKKNFKKLSKVVQKFFFLENFGRYRYRYSNFFRFFPQNFTKNYFFLLSCCNMFAFHESLSFFSPS